MTHRSPVAACASLAVATFAVGTDAWIVAGFLPAMARDLHTSPAAAGRSVTVFALVYALAAPLLAAATARQARRRTLVAALMLLGAFNALAAAAPGLAALLAARAGAGAAASLVTPTASVIAAASVPTSHRARALAVVISGLTLATAIGVPLAAQLSSIVSWRASLVGVAVLCGACALAVRIRSPEVPAGSTPPLRDRFAPLTHAPIRRVLLLTIVGMTAAYCPYAFIGQITRTSGDELTAMLAAYGVGAVVGSLASGRMADSIGPTRTLGVAYALMALAFLAAVPDGPRLVSLIVCAGWGAASWAQTPPSNTACFSMTRRTRPWSSA